MPVVIFSEDTSDQLLEDVSETTGSPNDFKKFYTPNNSPRKMSFYLAYIDCSVWPTFCSVTFPHSKRQIPVRNLFEKIDYLTC